MGENDEPQSSSQVSQISLLYSQETEEELEKVNGSLPSLNGSDLLNDLDSSTLDDENNGPVADTAHDTDEKPMLDGSNLDHENNDSVSDTNQNTEEIPPDSLADTSSNSGRNKVASSVINYIPSSLPAIENWPNIYNFKVFFEHQDNYTKSVSCTYSKIKDKLYVDKDVPCPINFSAKCPLPDDMVIRAVLLYSSPEHANEVVHRCKNHSDEENQKGILHADHLVRCESSMATYEVNKTTGRYSVIVPFENPPAGQQYSTYIYKFTCFRSCIGGPNKRPVMLMFTLERRGEELGRHKLDVKICACPGRDRKREEENLLAKKEGSVNLKRKKSELRSSHDALSTKKSKVQPNEDGMYVLTTNNKECYDFLKQMKKFYEISTAIENLPLDKKKSLFDSGDA